MSIGPTSSRRKTSSSSKDSAAKFLDEHAPPPRVEKWREAEIVERAMWREAGEAGLLCLAIPEAYGGAGGDFRHEVVLMEQIARKEVSGFSATLHNAIVVPYILHYGSEEQKKKWLPKMASGEYIGAIAMSEPGAGSDLQGVKTSARLARQSLCLQRAEDFHQQRPARRPRSSSSPRPTPRAAPREPRSSSSRPPGVWKGSTAAAISTRSAWKRRTRPNSSSTMSACRPRIFSAVRRARASSS